jgi:glycosyltransferase involved in cell wall biosynthesis
MKYNKLTSKNTPEILFITSFPPRECGIATYSKDLVKALNNKFLSTFKIGICPIETEKETFIYKKDVVYTLKADQLQSYIDLAVNINKNKSINLVVIQHEFGFFNDNVSDFIELLRQINTPIVVVFHTILKNPNEVLLANVKKIADLTNSIVVMTNTSFEILIEDYAIDADKITVIPHGTHLVPYSDKIALKRKYRLSGRKIMSTFGLLSSGKSIETTLEALPSIIAKNPDVLYLIIGKTHPTILLNENEKYRNLLENMVEELNLGKHVKFINQFLPLEELLEYLQLTDVYLFTSKDPNQAVSGTFSYAISCGCPIISTPIPHAREVLSEDAGILFDFGNSVQLANKVNRLLKDEILQKNISANGIHKIASTAWENSALAHAHLFKKTIKSEFELTYKYPKINLNHIRKMTSEFGILQFSIINQPDFESGYTLDDNARAMIAICQHFELTKEKLDLKYIEIYLEFIEFCLQNESYFLNYVDKDKVFTEQNNMTNLADSNGRAIWALGFLISMEVILPKNLVSKANEILEKALKNITKIHSTRSMAFIIKGLYYSNINKNNPTDLVLIHVFANRLVQMYKHEKTTNWNWFESYLTYANSVLPEALLLAGLITGNEYYKTIAKETFDFLLSKIFVDNKIKVVSNQGWMYREIENNNCSQKTKNGGEQPIDVAYTILALMVFYDVFKEENYNLKMHASFNWFLGENHLQQIIYNPCTGGCYDGLEETYINLNQGAESTISYLIARLVIEKTIKVSREKVVEDFEFELGELIN